MAENEKEVKKPETEAVELDLDELESVTGGGLRDVASKKTTKISSDTRSKI